MIWNWYLCLYYQFIIFILVEF